MKSFYLLPCWVCALVCALVAGCGSANMGSVTGKVTRDGQPITTGGSVTFSPIATGSEAAKAGSGMINPDGSYSISTVSDGDGAVLGKHRVSVSLDLPPGVKKTPPTPVLEYEVKPGANVFDIELSQKPAGR